MAKKICRNCGNEIDGNVCPKCGYGLNVSPFENGIKNKEYKERLADTALSLLINQKLIDPKKNLKHLTVEFGYLLIPKDDENICALLKVVTPKKALRASKVFYLGTQEDKMMLLNDKFDEAMFRKVSVDMLMMHNVDLQTVTTKDYVMELS